MPRKVLTRESFFPYHITNRTLGKRHYPLPMSKMWDLYSDKLCEVSWAYGAKIHAFVLMSNHYHLLISTPDSNIDEIVQIFQSKISLELQKNLNSKDWNFDTRYRWTLVKERNYFYNVYRYIYQNPLRAGLAKTVNEYPYSTFHGVAGYSKLSIPLSPHCFYDELNFGDVLEQETWLNTPIEDEQLSLIRKGIRRFNFALSQKDQNKLKPFLAKR